jgi:hypothetical protein
VGVGASPEKQKTLLLLGIQALPRWCDQVRDEKTKSIAEATAQIEDIAVRGVKAVI